MVYILDQVRAFEEEMLLRIKQQGLNVKPQILVVRLLIKFSSNMMALISLGNILRVGDGSSCFLHMYAGDSSNPGCKREQMQSRNGAY